MITFHGYSLLIRLDLHLNDGIIDYPGQSGAIIGWPLPIEKRSRCEPRSFRLRRLEGRERLTGHCHSIRRHKGMGVEAL